MNQIQTLAQYTELKRTEGVETRYSIPLIENEPGNEESIEKVMRLLSDFLTYQNMLAIRDYELRGKISEHVKQTQEMLEQHRQQALEMMLAAQEEGLNINIEAKINISFTSE